MEHIPLLSYRPKGSTSAENAAAMAHSEGLSYSLVYFNFLSASHTARAILTYMDANLTCTDFADPIVISEAIVIDTNLAKKAGLLGSNEWEEQVIKSIYSAAHYLRERFFTRVTYVFDQKFKKASFGRFMQVLLPRFIHTMEFHLQENGANGFFVGDKLSLADIHVAAIMDHFFLQPMAEPIRKALEASELLMKVKQSVDREPRLAAWKATQSYKALEEETIRFYARSAIVEDA
ncbi:Glutathione S-transferase S1 [Actinomortierella ambigua]|nr:Glutathione S-transferase S1 [Actinomortierella ambigua]